MPKLLLVRHGLTELNSARKFAGHTDVGLSEEGSRQAEKLGARLAGEKIDAVYCSDLQRAVSTAEAISNRHEAEPYSCYELRELHYGDAEGMTFDEIRENLPEVADNIRDFNLELSFPGGESMRGLISRAGKFLERLDDHTEDQTLLIVSHGGMLRTLLCELLNISQENWRKFRFDNASLTIIDIYSRGPILSLLNDTSHLQGED